MSISKRTALTSIELFAGAGGLTEGFRQAGIQTLVANELHQDASKTFRRNQPDTDLITRDIHEVEAEEILARSSSAVGYRIKPGDIDIVAGGPPCQGFSFAGAKEVTDPRNQLVWQQIRLVAALKPKFTIIENVGGMLKLYGGKMPNLIQTELEKLGYKVEYRLLSAADYGVPQMRKRLFFLASRIGTPIFPMTTHCELAFEGYKKYVTVGEAIGDLDFLEAGELSTEYRLSPQTDFQRKMRGDCTILYNHQASKHGERTISYFSHMIPGGSIETIPPELLTKKTGIQRWHPDRLSRAVVTAFEDFVHYRVNRIPTVREVARLQTFPDHYEFLGQRTSGNQNRKLKYSSQTQQVGNAVPPRMAAAIGNALVNAALVSK